MNYQTHLNELRKQTETLPSAKQHKTKVLAPLLDRIKALIDSLPENERYTPKTMEWFQERLEGRKARQAHPGEISNVLRRLSWHSRRTGRNAEQNEYKTHWYYNGAGNETEKDKTRS